ncbi:Ti-type conjugative transfer relaxase TraA [Sphingomonas sp.]|uniref:Ti-type conjugative transfer relaxase TraA n=1 Tax=Sphingomonas sp. TaxID=28214 RepID=UPI003D6D3CC5
MAIYHFSAKVISRANGSSAVASAAYRSASRLHDERIDRHHDFSNKAGVVHSEVMLPEGAPAHLSDRERLWNEVEAGEKRIDAQLAREIEFAIPRELDQAEGIRLARDFVQTEFVDRGMIADLNVHWDVGADGMPKPHAHVMLTMREVGEEGFGPKVREWNRTELLENWRERWGEHVNQRLAELDVDARIDHRSLDAQGIELEPQNKIGPAASRMTAQGLESERLDEHHDIARSNGDKIIADPRIALDAITRQQATFTKRDLAMFAHRHSDGKDQFDQVNAAVRASPDLVQLGKDGRGEERFTSRDMIETEQRLERATQAMAERTGHGLSAATMDQAIAAAESRGLILGGEQQAALAHVAGGRDLAIVTGYAGTGKSVMLGIARDGWESAGYRVYGAALSGIAAENLQSGSGIASRTIASLEHQWAQDRDLLNANDVLVIDEAGMIGSRQMERVVSEAEKRGAKVVLVGDPEQLQAIEAGAAFRSIAERHGGVEITDIRRQREDWQRDATRQLATGRTGEAIGAYDERGHVHAAETRQQARADLVERWDRDRQARPDASRIILTHTNDEVRDLNLAARDRLRASGALGEDITVRTERGGREFATGDRIMFLKNERSLGVKNGTLGTIQNLTTTRAAVMLDDGRSVAFDVKEYNQIDHGYAATVHKTQGVTVDQTHVLATPGLDRQAAYVALSRHRDDVDLHYGRDDFADQGKLVRTLSRDRAKDMASDYTRDFADRRAINVPSPARAANERALPQSPPPQRGMFDGLKLSAQPVVAAPDRTPLDRAVERFARAAQAIVAVRSRGGEALPHQATALETASKALDAIRPGAARDMREAISRDPGLIDDAAKGRTGQAIRAMALEAEVRINPVSRANRFIEDWNKLANREQAFRRDYDDRGVARVRADMGMMAKSLERDPQIESLVRQRLPQIGIRVDSGASLSHDLQKWLSRSRDIGLSL